MEHQRPAAEPTSWYLSSRVPITVGEQHLDGLTVTLKHGVRIRGRIVTDQGAGGLPSFTSAHIVQFSAADGRTIPFLPARVGGRFAQRSSRDRMWRTLRSISTPNRLGMS